MDKITLKTSEVFGGGLQPFPLVADFDDRAGDVGEGFGWS
jgi:hypothetical protein